MNRGDGSTKKCKTGFGGILMLQKQGSGWGARDDFR